jgi:outer membrane receptor protein involved in Fe transport
VVTREEIQRSGARSLPDALRLTAGVWVQETNLGGGSPFVRGLTGNQVLLMVDGVRINDSTTRFGPNQALNSIDPAIVERIEVLRGPASVLYGSDAIGGVIAIWTRRSRAGAGAGVSGELDTAWLSAVDGWRSSLGVGWSGTQSGILGIGSLWEFGDLETARGEVPFTGYTSGSLFQTYETRLSEQDELRVTARYQRDDDVPRTDRLVTGFGQTEPTDDRHHFVRQQREGYLVSLTHEEEDAIADQVQVRLSARRSVEELERRSRGSAVLRVERDEVETAGIGVDFRKAVGEQHLLTWGLDFDHDDVDSTRRDLDTSNGTSQDKAGKFPPSSRYESFGLFLQDEIFALDPVDVTAGLRWSYYEFGMDSGRLEGDFDALTASLQAATDLTARTRLVGGLAQGFRAPNLDDLGKDGEFAGGTELANPDLDAEQSLTAELGIESSGEAWEGGLGLFFTSISDLVGRALIDAGDPGVAGDETYQRANQGTAEIWGIEAQARHRLGDVDSPWSIAASAAWTRGRQYDDTVDEGTGEQPLLDVPLRRIPPLHGSLGLHWNAPESLRPLSWARLEVRAAAEQDELHPQDESDPRIDPDGTSGWSVLDLDLGGPIGAPGRGTSWSLGLHNLLDEAYRVHGSGIDGAGFNLVVGLRLSI